MKESAFQASIIRTIKNLCPGCIVLKNDAGYIQGIPDILVLYGVTWAALEFKKSEDAPRRPNQEYYVDKMSKMSYAAFIYPANTEVVLHEMLDHFDRINRRGESGYTAADIVALQDSQSQLQQRLQSSNYSQA